MIKIQKLIHDYIKRDDEGNVAGTVRAINGVDLHVEPGQFIAVLGHNGSGKSTLAKHLNALLFPTEGAVWVDGLNTRDEKNLWEIRREAGMVFQNPDNQIIAQVVEEDVGFGPENIGVPTEEIWTRVEESLKTVGMLEHRKKSPNRLSGGQKQRVSIAGVIAMEPKCIIFDEPTAMLDPNGRKEVIKAAKKLNKEKGITVILITHYMEEVIVADKIFVMNHGEVAMQVNALDHITVDIPEDQFIGLIGHTGSGKSTFVQTLNGLLKVTSGHIYYNGEDIDGDQYDKKKLRSDVGLVFQYPEHQLFEVDVISDVCFGPRNLGLSESETRERAIEALESVRMPKELYKSSPFDLSGGQKRRAAIAGVLAMRPKILILDEPTAGLDPKGRDEILGLIARMKEERDMTIILVSHSMDDVARYVERIMVMGGGKLLFDDEPVKVFRHVKELEELGLSAPQITYVMRMLRERGLNVNADVLRVKEAAEEILAHRRELHV